MNQIPANWILQPDGSYSAPSRALRGAGESVVPEPSQQNGGQADKVAVKPLESELHDEIEAELKRRRWYYVHSRMDRATTTALGVTDFIIAVPITGKTIWMEVKRKGGKLTKEQNVTRHLLTASLHIHRVVYSLAEAIEIFDS